MHYLILFSTRATPIISYSGSPLVWRLSGRETKVVALNPLWRAYFLRLAMRFRSASTCNPPMCEYYGNLVGD